MNVFSHGSQACKFFNKLYGKSLYTQFLRYDSLISSFKKQFKNGECFLASSSGRVEIVGNHTDHNGGKVIGCAVNLDVASAFKPNGGNVVQIVSEGYPPIEFDVSRDRQLSGGVGLAEGVAAYLKAQGYAVGGFDLYTDSTVPGGAGVSSSAAFEMLIATIINMCFNDGAIPLDVMAKAGQYAEEIYLCKPCGLLDQGASLSGGLTLFDFANGFKCERLNVAVSQLRFVLIDTGSSHAGLASLYESIPAEMSAVARFFGKQRLIDVESQLLFNNEQALRGKLGDRPFLRAKHFFEENERVDCMTDALKRGDADEVIRLINASGDSSLYQLQNCAVNEQDTAIADAITYARSLGNVGARVHGGGFAGTVLCVVKSCDFKDFIAKMSAKYGQKHILPMTIRNIGATVL